MSASHPIHRPDIDGLRAMAILGVLAFHAFPQAVPGGFAGVDVFFVISGYVVSLSLLARASTHDGTRIAAFYARRVRRLFPALLCMLPIVGLAAFWLLSTAQLALLGKHILGSAGFAQNLVLWQEAGYFDAASHEKWLLHLWSLGIEEQFYLLLPLLFLLRQPRPAGADAKQEACMTTRGSSPETPAPWLLPVLVMLATASLLLALWQSRYAPSAGFYWPLGRFWEFLLGVALASWHLRARTLEVAPSHRHGMRTQEILAVLAFAALCLAFAVMNDRRWHGWHFPGPMAIWPALATLALLCTVRSTLNQRLLAHPLMRWLGLVSYPLYLWHWPIMAWLNSLDPQHLWPWTRLPGLLLALALAALTHHLVEQPVRRLALRKPRAVTAGLVVGMVGVAAIGYGLWRHPPTSWPDRHAPPIAQAVRWDEATLYRDDTCLAHPAVNPWQRRDFFCRGNPDTARWVLLGDSHGNALAAGLMKAMPDQWLNLGGGGCMPFGGVDSGSDQMGLQCPHEIPEAFLHHIVTSPHIRGVLIDLRGAYYVNGDGVGALETGVRRWLREVPGLASSAGAAQADGQAAIFRAGVRRTLGDLGQAGKQVVWVLGTPELGADVDACLRPRPGLGWLGPAPVCAISRQAHEARNAAYRSIVLAEVQRWNAQRPVHAPPVRVLDPVDMLCERDRCPLVRHGVPLYRDGDHLSIQGSDLLAGWLLPRLQKADD